MKKIIKEYFKKEITKSEIRIKGLNFEIFAKVETFNSWSGKKIGEFEEELLTNFKCPFEVKLSNKYEPQYLAPKSELEADRILEILNKQLEGITYWGN